MLITSKAAKARVGRHVKYGEDGAAEEIGALFSGGLSADELNRLGGAEAINSKAGAIEAQNKVVNIAEGAVKIEAAVSGSYDVRQLLEDVNSELGQLGNI